MVDDVEDHDRNNDHHGRGNDDRDRHSADHGGCDHYRPEPDRDRARSLDDGDDARANKGRQADEGRQADDGRRGRQGQRRLTPGAEDDGLRRDWLYAGPARTRQAVSGELEIPDRVAKANAPRRTPSRPHGR